MMREFLLVDQFKATCENILNCWLSYSISQPIQFDMAILSWFALHYVGFAKFSRNSFPDNDHLISQPELTITKEAGCSKDILNV